MESVQTLPPPSAQPSAPVDHTLGARRDVLDLPATEELPPIRISLLRWEPRSPADPDRTVVLVHGLTGSAATQAPIAAALAARGRPVVAVDLPGHGQTSWLDERGEPVADRESLDPAIYALDRAGQMMRRAIDALRLPHPPALVGHSWGAAVSAAAALHGVRVSRLILVDPPFLVPQEALDLATDLAAELQPDPLAAREAIRALEPETPELELTAMGEALSQASATAVIAAATQAGYTPFEFLRRWRAKPPRMRVDAIVGNPSLGGLVPGRARLALRLLLGPRRVHYMSQAGHSPMRSHFEEFMARLERLLDAG